MKKKLAIVLCSMPFAMAPIAYAQTGSATEGTTSPQSGTQTDMGKDGAPNMGGKNNTSSSAAGSTGSGAASGAATSSGATAGAAGGVKMDSGDRSAATSSSPTTAGTAAGSSMPSATGGESFENLKGKAVYNENDEKIGDVKDIVLSSDGKATHVLLGVGGFVGVGEHLVAIPFNEINTTGDKLTIRGYTKDQLKKMPAYERPRDEPARAPMGAPR